MKGSTSQKLCWLGNSGRILVSGTSGRKDGRYCSIFDIRQINSGPIIHKKLDNENFDTQLHFDETLSMLFMVNLGQQTACHYFYYTDPDLVEDLGDGSSCL